MASKIGILDSGVGGLSVLREIRKKLPGNPLVYVGDSAWCPYGPKAPLTIQKRVFSIVDFLIAQGCDLLVVACNSATLSAVEALRASYLLPFVGMEPAIKPGVAATKSGVIGVLATEASLAGERYHQLVHQHGPGVRILTRPAPEFVELVEAGLLAGSQVESAVHQHLDPLLHEGADTLVLGCTHYPFLRPVMQAIAGNHLTILDTGQAVAEQTARLAKPGAGQASEIVFYTTADPPEMNRLLPLLLPEMPPPPPARLLAL
ncbi:MAG: glutamate racemase [Verrucomicrobiota bacterium]